MPVIIWINGGFGAGKTTLAQELHRRLPDAIVYDPEDVTCASRCLRGRSPQLVTHVGVKATSWLLAGGADLQAVKERLGHASIATTEKYLHTLPDSDDATLDAFTRIRERAVVSRPRRRRTR